MDRDKRAAAGYIRWVLAISAVWGSVQSLYPRKSCQGRARIHGLPYGGCVAGDGEVRGLKNSAFALSTTLDTRFDNLQMIIVW